MQQVKTLEELKTLAENGREFTVMLNHGIKAGKYIAYNPTNDYWQIFSNTSGEWGPTFKTAEFEKEAGTVAKALKVGALYAD